MIKLMDLLLEAKLSPKEQEQYIQALAILQDDTLDEGIMDKLKKLGLTATVIAALLASPQLTQAQKTPLEDLAKQTTSATTPKRVGTAVDGIVGEYTSQYKFPLRAEDTITTVVKVNGQEISRSKKVKGKEHTSMISVASEQGISKPQMIEWNKFVDWMKSKGYAGNPKMNNVDYSWDVVDKYAKVNPNFWIETEDDVKAVQAALQEERKKAIEEWKVGKRYIKIGGIIMNPNNPEDVNTVETRFMPIVKPVAYIY